MSRVIGMFKSKLLRRRSQRLAKVKLRQKLEAAAPLIRRWLQRVARRRQQLLVRCVEAAAVRSFLQSLKTVASLKVRPRQLATVQRLAKSFLAVRRARLHTLHLKCSKYYPSHKKAQETHVRTQLLQFYEEKMKVYRQAHRLQPDQTFIPILYSLTAELKALVAEARTDKTPEPPPVVTKTLRPRSRKRSRDVIQIAFSVTFERSFDLVNLKKT